MLTPEVGAKRRLAQAPAKLVPCFGGCDATVESRTTPKVYCPDCRKARKRESARHAMTKQRRKRGVPEVKGTTRTCERCSGAFTLDRSLIARFCPSCAVLDARDRARVRGERMNRLLGKEPIGAIKSCKNCGIEFAKARKGKQFYCADCMLLQQSGKLPSLRDSTSRWRRNRYASDPAFALNDLMRHAIWSSLDGAKAGRHWESLVGYTLHDLQRHLDRQFTRKMSWANRGAYWQIDHIQPLASFKFTTAEDPEFKAAWALTNLRPLGKLENLSKRAKRTLLL